LAEGELVCIFPEGALTKDGQIAPFKSGVEKILERAALRGQDVPVVPMALKNMWGSMWSKQDSRLRRARLPRRLRAPIEVMAGEPVAGSAASAELLEARVRALRGDVA
jgi:1-acyl-sn-glycerol-3-phosphate acyltransferase